MKFKVDLIEARLDRWTARGDGPEGEANVRPYDDTRAGVGYVLKCHSGRDDYETRKFIQADQAPLSTSFYAILRALDRIKRDTQRAHAKKNERR